jgi:hypothetical protein
VTAIGPPFAHVHRYGRSYSVHSQLDVTAHRPLRCHPRPEPDRPVGQFAHRPDLRVSPELVPRADGEVQDLQAQLRACLSVMLTTLGRPAARLNHVRRNARCGKPPGGIVVGHMAFPAGHSRFGWADLLNEGILIPVRAGQLVMFRPPGWDEHQREGAILVPAGCTLFASRSRS